MGCPPTDPSFRQSGARCRPAPSGNGTWPPLDRNGVARQPGAQFVVAHVVLEHQRDAADGRCGVAGMAAMKWQAVARPTAPPRHAVQRGQIQGMRQAGDPLGFGKGRRCRGSTAGRCRRIGRRSGAKVAHRVAPRRRRWRSAAGAARRSPRRIAGRQRFLDQWMSWGQWRAHSRATSARVGAVDVDHEGALSGPSVSRQRHLGRRRPRCRGRSDLGSGIGMVGRLRQHVLELPVGIAAARTRSSMGMRVVPQPPTRSRPGLQPRAMASNNDALTAARRAVSADCRHRWVHRVTHGLRRDRSRTLFGRRTSGSIMRKYSRVTRGLPNALAITRARPRRSRPRPGPP